MFHYLIALEFKWLIHRGKRTMAREITTCPGRTVWVVLRVFLGKHTQAEIQTAVTGGLCPVFMSECATVVLQSQVVIYPLSFFSIQWQKVFSAFSSSRLWAPPLSSLRLSASLCPTDFITSLLHACFATAARLVVFLSVHNTVSCSISVVLAWLQYQTLLITIFPCSFQKPEQGTDLIRWNIPHSPCCFHPPSTLSHSPAYITIFCLLSLPPCSNKNRLLIFLNSEAYLIAVVIWQPELNSRGALRRF